MSDPRIGQAAAEIDKEMARLDRDVKRARRGFWTWASIYAVGLIGMVTFPEPNRVLTLTVTVMGIVYGIDTYTYFLKWRMLAASHRVGSEMRNALLNGDWKEV